MLFSPFSTDAMNALRSFQESPTSLRRRICSAAYAMPATTNTRTIVGAMRRSLRSRRTHVIKHQRVLSGHTLPRSFRVEISGVRRVVGLLRRARLFRSTAASLGGVRLEERLVLATGRRHRLVVDRSCFCSTRFFSRVVVLGGGLVALRRIAHRWRLG